MSEVTWDNTIKGFFTGTDIQHMKGYGIYLDDHESVKRNTRSIYGKVESGQMPPDGPRWSAEKVATFSSWADAGCP